LSSSKLKSFVIGKFGFFCLFFVTLWFELGTLRASCLLDMCSTTSAMPPARFCSGYFGDRNLLFAQTSLKPWSSQFQPPKLLGLHMCVTSARLERYFQQNERESHRLRKILIKHISEKGSFTENKRIYHSITRSTPR
jgi:hypothetical protein